MLNVTRQTISKYETGESVPDLDKLELLAKYFEVSLDELVYGEKTNAFDMKKVMKLLKAMGILLGCLFIIDFISLIVYFFINGMPS